MSWTRRERKLRENLTKEKRPGESLSAHFSHQKPCSILKLLHQRKAIRRGLDECSLKEGPADPSLTAKWKAPSPKNACVLMCPEAGMQSHLHPRCSLDLDQSGSGSVWIWIWKQSHLPSSLKPAGSRRNGRGCALWLQHLFRQMSLWLDFRVTLVSEVWERTALHKDSALLNGIYSEDIRDGPRML